MEVVVSGPSNAQVRSRRLDAEVWTLAALDLLAEQGVDGVRVEVLAKRMAVSKGSFYWHFRDRNELLGGMLEHWRRRATVQIIERFDRGEATPLGRLRALLLLPLHGQAARRGADVELSLRLWGRQDERAAAALAEIDELRLRYITGLFRELGVAAELAHARAVLVYSYMRVAATLTPGRDASVRQACEDFLVSVAP